MKFEKTSLISLLVSTGSFELDKGVGGVEGAVESVAFGEESDEERTESTVVVRDLEVAGEYAEVRGEALGEVGWEAGVAE